MTQPTKCTTMNDVRVFAEDMRRQDGASPESGWAADRDTQRAAQRCVSALVQRHDGRKWVCDIGAAR